jgi:hypothetical protein
MVEKQTQGSGAEQNGGTELGKEQNPEEVQSHVATGVALLTVATVA